jgi:hypothetical protein
VTLKFFFNALSVDLPSFRFGHMMQSASPDPSAIYPEQDQMQTDNITEISSEHSEPPQIQISSPQPEPVQSSKESSPDKLSQENVVCRWNNCMTPFTSHCDLANHLSQGTIFHGMSKISVDILNISLALSPNSTHRLEETRLLL